MSSGPNIAQSAILLVHAVDGSSGLKSDGTLGDHYSVRLNIHLSSTSVLSWHGTNSIFAVEGWNKGWKIIKTGMISLKSCS